MQASNVKRSNACIAFPVFYFLLFFLVFPCLSGAWTTAERVVPGFSTSSAIDSQDPEHLYPVWLLRDDALSVDLAFSHADGNLDLQFLDEEGNVLASSESTDDDERVIVEGLSAGFFTIRVSFTGSSACPYTLAVSPAETSATDRVLRQ